MAWYATLIHFHLWMTASASDENGVEMRAELLRFNSALEVGADASRQISGDKSACVYKK